MYDVACEVEARSEGRGFSGRLHPEEYSRYSVSSRFPESGVWVNRSLDFRMKLDMLLTHEWPSKYSFPYSVGKESYAHDTFPERIT